MPWEAIGGKAATADQAGPPRQPRDIKCGALSQKCARESRSKVSQKGRLSILYLKFKSETAARFHATAANHVFATWTTI